MTIGFRADIKKPPDLVRPGGPPNQRRALSRGTSPANLDRNAALVAHAGCKARTFEALRAWVWPPNPGPRVGAALTHLGRVHVRSRRTGAGAIVFSCQNPQGSVGFAKPIRQ